MMGEVSLLRKEYVTSISQREDAVPYGPQGKHHVLVKRQKQEAGESPGKHCSEGFRREDQIEWRKEFK